MENDDPHFWGAVLVSFIFGSILVFGIIGPIYGVWQAEKYGQAELARAEYNRQIAVVEAEAKLNSAGRLAEAEILRANGVAKANQIIGESLKENEAYLRYLWIEEVAGKDVGKTVVYIPTEANMPILEATRLTNENITKNNEWET
jgi:regulator of protease activity HflC (stomatin/prohibitin superfamily)